MQYLEHYVCSGIELGLTSDLYKFKKANSPMLSNDLLIIPNIWLAFDTTVPTCALNFSLLSIKIPRSFSSVTYSILDLAIPSFISKMLYHLSFRKLLYHLSFRKLLYHLSFRKCYTIFHFENIVRIAQIIYNSSIPVNIGSVEVTRSTLSYHYNLSEIIKLK